MSERVVLVTGGASGMGAACVREFVALGDTVVSVDIDASGATRVADTVANNRVDVIVGDVSDSAFCAATVADVVADHGRLDVVVNCAGTIHRSDSTGTNDDDWRRVMAVNVDGVFFMSRAAVEVMGRAGGGAIVNFGSIWGDVGAAGVVAYCASKGAVHQLTRAMALDHVGSGIRINAVAPGEVDTPMLASHREHRPSDADLKRLADETIPMKRLAQPEEIARVVVFLASDDASYMTGAVVAVDAGYTAR